MSNIMSTLYIFLLFDFRCDHEIKMSQSRTLPLEINLIAHNGYLTIEGYKGS